MTPFQFATKECANHTNDGGCLGVPVMDLVDPDGPWQKRTALTPRFLNKRNRCALTEAGKRCLYFEEVVLPLADCPSPKSEQGLQAKRQKAKASYLAQVGLATPAKKKPRLCECGEILGKGKRYCEKCAAQRRRETRRKSQKSWRAN